MENILKQIDKIHAEAVKRAENDQLFNAENPIVKKENEAHIANICQLRNMIKRAVDKFPNVTTEDRGEYYLTDEEKENWGSTASENTDEEGFQEFVKENY